MLDNINIFIDLYINESSISLSKLSDNDNESIIFLGKDNFDDWVMKNNLYSKSFNIYENPFNCEENEVYELKLKDSSGDGWKSYGKTGYVSYNDQKIYFEDGHELKVYLTAGKDISLTKPNLLNNKRTDVNNYYKTFYIKDAIAMWNLNNDLQEYGWKYNYHSSYWPLHARDDDQLDYIELDTWDWNTKGAFVTKNRLN